MNEQPEMDWQTSSIGGGFWRSADWETEIHVYRTTLTPSGWGVVAIGRWPTILFQLLEFFEKHAD